MKLILTSLFIGLIAGTILVKAQQDLPLTDDMEPSSVSKVTIKPGEYNVRDTSRNGLIRIINKEKIVIDGKGVKVNGLDTLGYLIYIRDSKNIQIKNFESASAFFYAVSISNSENIIIDSCNFSGNSIDSTGWISIWTDADQALGGGVILDSCKNVKITNNVMKNQNDGVALYHCDSVEVGHNDFDWNTSYGIRMYFTNDSRIHHNLASNINRPNTDPSDCSSILMIVSNSNRVDSNDFRNSGDGIFLGQYQYSQIPSANYFAYNDCSGSPHNAIEATFADGNIFKRNICNTSQYGLWLGFSFNNIVDSNEIYDNQVAGIAIERGYNNILSHNIIDGNPTGIQLFQRDQIPPYTNTSRDYIIKGNIFQENNIGFSTSLTENSVIEENFFNMNYKDIYYDSNPAFQVKDTIRNNRFTDPVSYFIENNAASDIYAPGNNFNTGDIDYISAKMYDSASDPILGTIYWDSFLPGENINYQTTAPTELTEPPSQWNSYTEECMWRGLAIPTIVSYDPDIKLFGEASVRISTGNGWFVNAHFRPEGYKTAKWDISGSQNLSFWLKGLDTNQGAFQFNEVRIGNSWGSYYRYQSSDSQIWNTALNKWTQFIIPLKGNTAWHRTIEGHVPVNFNEINYVEIWADTYGVGFQLWIDGMTFGEPMSVDDNENEGHGSLEIYPDPVNEMASIIYDLPGSGQVNIVLIDIFGNVVKQVCSNYQYAGNKSIQFDSSGLPPGIYYCRLNSSDYSETKKIIIFK